MSPPFWAKPRFVLFIILFYLAAHFAMRMAMGEALSVDDSDQALFSQSYAWAYRYKAPPLFVWMLTLLGSLIPVGAFPISLLRYMLLGIVYGLVYLTARRLIADPRLAALSVYSFAAINTFAEASHRNLLHSTALAALLSVAWYVFVRLAASPRLGWYLALGAAFGVGMLAKWNFVVFALALPLACLLNREARALVLTWKIVPAALVAAMIVLPTLIATVKMGAPEDESVRAVLEAGGGPGLAQIAEGSWNLVDAAIIYSLPLLPIVLILFGPSLWRGIRTAGPEAGPFPRVTTAGLVGTTMAIGLALLWLLVLFLGATEFKVRYMYPVLLILPVWLFMVVERGRPSDLSINVFALVMAALAVGLGAKRIATQFTGLLSCGLCLEMRPYPQLAAQLGDAGYRGGGTVLASGDIAGNLRVVFPKARVIDPSYEGWPAPSGEGQCLIVWHESGSGVGVTLPPPYGLYLSDALHGRPEATYADGAVTAPMLAPAEGEFSLGYRLYEEPNGDCR